MKFTPRLIPVPYNNKYYIHMSKGGLNRCIEIENGSVLPNCVGYAWGRFYELTGKRPTLSRGNAENWYDNTADGYKRGTTPKEGAIICWRKGKAFNSKDGYGHVAVVEKVLRDGSFITSNSAYGGKRWYLKIIGKDCKMSGHIFQGFIYPKITFEKSEEKYKTGNYRVTDAWLLNVRTGPSTDFDKVMYKNLTKNAKSQIYEIARKKENGYVMGVEFTVSDVFASFGKTPSGWVCLDYCTKI